LVRRHPCSARGVCRPGCVLGDAMTPSPRVAKQAVVLCGGKGTGGALRHARDVLDEVFLVVNGDTYLELDYAQLCTALPADAEALMVVTSAPSHVQPNVAVADGRVVSYNKQDGVIGGWTDTGAAVIRRCALDKLSADTASDLGELFAALIADATLAAWCIANPFYDIGTATLLRRFDQFLEQRI
jgi:NDP-sugar pyrophosphorylase family protein